MRGMRELLQDNHILDNLRNFLVDRVLKSFYNGFDKCLYDNIFTMQLCFGRNGGKQ